EKAGGHQPKEDNAANATCDVHCLHVSWARTRPILARGAAKTSCQRCGESVGLQPVRQASTRFNPHRHRNRPKSQESPTIRLNSAAGGEMSRRGLLPVAHPLRSSSRPWHVVSPSGPMTTVKDNGRRRQPACGSLRRVVTDGGFGKTRGQRRPGV